MMTPLSGTIAEEMSTTICDYFLGATCLLSGIVLIMLADRMVDFMGTKNNKKTKKPVCMASVTDFPCL